MYYIFILSQVASRNLVFLLLLLFLSTIRRSKWAQSEKMWPYTQYSHWIIESLFITTPKLLIQSINQLYYPISRNKEKLSNNNGDKTHHRPISSNTWIYEQKEEKHKMNFPSLRHKGHFLSTFAHYYIVCPVFTLMIETERIIMFEAKKKENDNRRKKFIQS